MVKKGIFVLLVIVAFVGGGVLGGFLGATFFSASPTESPIEPYSHTILIDGINDFYLDRELFNTSSSASGFYGYISWDSNYFYVGLNDSNDISGINPDIYLLIYFGNGNLGTTIGKLYNTQQPNLAFNTSHHFWWRSDVLTCGMDAWNGTNWADTDLNFTGEWSRAGAYFESRFLLENLGSPSSLKLHISMIYTGGGTPSTWCSIPHNSVDAGGANDPDYISYYDFDLEDTTAPNTYIPLYP